MTLSFPAHRWPLLVVTMILLLPLLLGFGDRSRFADIAPVSTASASIEAEEASVASVAPVAIIKSHPIPYAVLYPRPDTDPDPVIAPRPDTDPYPVIRTSGGLVLPHPRPDRRSIFPDTEPSLRSFVMHQTGINPETDETHYKLKKGEGLATLLDRAGLSATDREAVLTLIGKYRSLRSLPAGLSVYVIAPTRAAPGGVRLELERERDMDLSLYKSPDGDWWPWRSFRPYEHFFTYLTGDIENSLYRAGRDAGMNASVFNDFIRIMSFSVDFQREVQPGDRFKALVEFKRDMVTGEVASQNVIHYLSMDLSGSEIAFFRYETLAGSVDYFDIAGHSATRALLRTPINGARLSSGYGSRKHPILGYTKAHRGVDFAASTGTPIMAAGDGVIERAGWNGTYGRYIRIRHNGTYETAYAHLSSIGKGIHAGARVSQGQVIGYVGSSGRSTGPHLHYEILVDGRQVNPLAVQMPQGEKLKANEMERFTASLRIIHDELAAQGAVRYAENANRPAATSGQ